VIKGQVGILKFKHAANPDLWPNVLTTVAEFNPTSVPQIVSSFGEFIKIPLFLMAIMGSLFMIFPTMRFLKKINSLIWAENVILGLITL
jgi:hypothetical protein